MKRFPGAYALALSTAVLPALSATAHAEEVVVGYQQIVGPFLSAIADGRFDSLDSNHINYSVTATRTES